MQFQCIAFQMWKKNCILSYERIMRVFFSLLLQKKKPVKQQQQWRDLELLLICKNLRFFPSITTTRQCILEDERISKLHTTLLNCFLIRRRIICKISGFIEDCVSKTCRFFSSPVNLLDQRSSEATNRTSQYFCCSRDGRRFSEEGRGSDNFLLSPESTTLYPPIETTFEFVIIIILFFVLFFCSGSSLSFSLSLALWGHIQGHRSWCFQGGRALIQFCCK